MQLDGRVRRLLVVDDHDDTRFITARLLEREHTSVVTAPTIAIAIELSKYIRFDLLIADVQLPDGSGLELLSELRKRYPIQGIVVSGHGRRSDVDQALAAGFSRHFLKPFDLSSLLRSITELTADLKEDTAADPASAHDWNEESFRGLIESLADHDRQNLLKIMKSRSDATARRMKDILLECPS